VHGRGERQIEAVGGERGVRQAHGHHRQPARRAGGLQPLGQAQRLLGVAAGQVDDGGFDLQVGEAGHGRIGPARGDRAPAQPVQAIGQRTRQDVVARDDQDPRLDACRHVSRFPDATARASLGMESRRGGIGQ
jgi:hypothetical protein